MDPALTDEEERFMRWLEEDDVSGHHAGDALAVPDNWHTLRHNVDHLRELLRATLPASQEPPATGAFNEEVRRRLE